MANSDRLVWIDCEMTGLYPEKDELVEIAAIVTDGELNELDAGINLVIKCSDAALEQMDAFVVNMHTESDLITEIPNGIALEDAQAQVLAYVMQHVPEPKKAPLAGSSVYTDRGFLTKYMPELDDYLHYRLVDVSSIKELVRRWYPRTYFSMPEKHGNHRALGDIRESIAELRYYREAVFIPAPGLETAAAKEIGQRHVVDHG